MSRPMLFLFALSAFCLLTATARAAEELRVTPAEVTLSGNFSQMQLLAARTDADGQATDRTEDLTHRAEYATSNPEVVQVHSKGRLVPVGNGTAEITVTVDGLTRAVPVTVRDVQPEPAIDYDLQVRPLISKAGCNMGACHAAQYGQGGFKLSVFAFAPDEDYAEIVRDSQQRRINRLEPERSLLLQKPTMRIPHGGGRRLEAGSRDYQLLAAWIRGGSPGPRKDSPQVTKVAVTPTQRVGQENLQQQLRVEATYSDGSVRDVTAWAKFDSLDEGVVTVTSSGLCTTAGRGQAPVMVRYEGQADICMFVVPFGPSPELPGWTPRNFVDELAAAKFRELGIEPSPLCDDATFIRRACLDAIGTLPKPEEVQEFLKSPDPRKREKLIDRLLGLTGDPALDTYNDFHAAYWTLKWSDLIRNNSRDLGDQGMWALHNWIKEAFRKNLPMDQFVRELVTAKGSIYSNGPANYFRVNKNANELAESTAQLFLGLRLTCAQCHHHPFEKYGQDDYYSFAAFFARVGTKNSQEFGLFGREQVVMVRNSGDVRHPRTGQVMPPKPLEGEPVDHPLDRRIALAEWLTSRDNSAFAQSVVNRYVAYLLGRGLVEPVDDLRATNPPSNPALMDALAKEFVASGYNLKHLIRTIMVSRLYQLDSQPTPQNVTDRRFYSHFLVKRLPAEPLLDAIDDVTGTQTKFKDLPLGTRAIELPDAEYPDYFLNTFAKPRRASVCECERSPDENLAQALHMLNGDVLTNKIGDKNGRLAKLIAAKKSPDEIVTDLFLATLCRPPTAEELSTATRFAAENGHAKEAYEDLLWALMNSKEFLFVQ